VFWHVKVNDVDHNNQWATKTLTRTQNIHCVTSCASRNPTKLAIRGQLCCCAFCINEDYVNCTSLHHVEDWKIHFLIHLNPSYIQSVAKGANDEEDWQHGGNGVKVK